MRLGRLVAAGLAAGAAAGFLGALLRPRTVQSYGSDAERPATGYRGDPGPVRVPESAVLREPAFATSAPDGGATRRLDVDAADGSGEAAVVRGASAGASIHRADG